MSRLCQAPRHCWRLILVRLIVILNRLHLVQLCAAERVLLALGFLIGLGALVCLPVHVAHHLPVNLVNVRLRCSELFLKTQFFLLQGIFRAFRVLVDDAFDFSLQVPLIHGIDDVLAVGVELRRENLRHCLRCIGLVDTCRLLDELLQRLVPSHGLVQRAQEMFIELLFRVHV